MLVKKIRFSPMTTKIQRATASTHEDSYRRDKVKLTNALYDSIIMKLATRLFAVVLIAVVAWGIGSIVLKGDPISPAATYAPTPTPSAATPTPAPATASTPPASSAGSVQLCAEPTCGYGAVSTAIADAKSSVELVMYEFDDQQIEQALIADAHRGVSVRVFLDSAYHGHYINDSVAQYLGTHGVGVKLAPSNIIVHEKAVIVDNSTLYLMSGNLTPNYFATSADWLVTDTQPADVNAATQAFNADWSGNVGGAEQGQVGDLIFSPHALSPYLNLINSAKSSILISSEEMIQPQVISALEAAAHRGVNVTLLMTASNLEPTIKNELESSGVHCDLLSAGGLYIHAKTLVVDGHTAIIGSQNDSTASLVYNRELSIEVTSPALVNQIVAAFNKWAS
jgi:phosphatidylserine/phosphatidylglycerophosphate/cardiolipin synthase-like enzyme